MAWSKGKGTLGNGGRGDNSFRPVRIEELELELPVPAELPPGPLRLLIRLGGRPVGFLAVAAGQEPQGVAALRRLITEEVRGSLPSGLLAPTELVPADGFAPGAARWPSATTVDGISVVVTTCGASRGLVRTLESLRQQTVRPHEIIVVDNRPATSGVAELLAGLALPDVVLVQEARPGLSRARNAGLARAGGEVTAFTDDDVLVDPQWIQALAGGFLDDNVACVTGLVLPLELQTPAQCLFEEFGGFAKGFQRRRYDLGEHRGTGALYPYAAGVFGTGANAAFRTATLRRLGGFDEDLGTGRPAMGGEDLDIYLTIVQSGSALVYEPGALIRHLHHPDVAGLRRQVHSYGVGMTAMVTKRLATQRPERRDILARIPIGARHLLDPRSSKNIGKGRQYPRALTLLEIAGMVQGPYAYWKSRRTQ